MNPRVILRILAITVLFLAVPVSSCQPTKGPVSVNSIIEASSRALGGTQSVTVRWKYQGYKGSQTSGQAVVGQQGADMMNTGPNIVSGDFTIRDLARAIDSLTNMDNCEPGQLADDHLIRGPNSTVDGVRVEQVLDRESHGLMLAADVTLPALPREATVCTGPFQAEAGTTELSFSYRPVSFLSPTPP